jgi:hypothetical protein
MQRIQNYCLSFVLKSTIDMQINQHFIKYQGEQLLVQINEQNWNWIATTSISTLIPIKTLSSEIVSNGSSHFYNTQATISKQN